LSLAVANGGILVNRELIGKAGEEAAGRATTLLQVPLDKGSAADLLLIATGALSPLTGFMTSDEYHCMVESMRLPNGLVLGLPITLAVEKEVAHAVGIGSEVALCYKDVPLATMVVHDVFSYDKQQEAQAVYRTTDVAHPGVQRLYAQGEYLLGGPITLFRRPPSPFAVIENDPAAVRAIAANMGWQTMVGFQTRNPIHRAHEYMQKCALEIVDGLLLHPLMGETKADDIPACTRLSSYQAILANYYPPDRVLLAGFPAAMRYAGPREAVFHAICRRNYGCTHFIVGRDHAGVGNYYGTYDAQRIFAQFSAVELGIEPLFFEHTFYCQQCAQMASAKTCPHPTSQHISLSGSKVRAMLAAGQAPPAQITRPEVAVLLMNAAQIARNVK
jgi:sulfate adenylyltransferase